MDEYCNLLLESIWSGTKEQKHRKHLNRSSKLNCQQGKRFIGSIETVLSRPSTIQCNWSLSFDPSSEWYRQQWLRQSTLFHLLASVSLPLPLNGPNTNAATPPNHHLCAEAPVLCCWGAGGVAPAPSFCSAPCSANSGNGTSGVGNDVKGMENKLDFRLVLDELFKLRPFVIILMGSGVSWLINRLIHGFYLQTNGLQLTWIWVKSI